MAGALVPGGKKEGLYYKPAQSNSPNLRSSAAQLVFIALATLLFLLYTSIHFPDPRVYQDVVSKCRILHGRYLATPWLSSPHFQTSFLSFFGRPPAFHYRRQLFHTPDGGTMALDWLVNSDDASFEAKDVITKHDKTPIVIVIPGLTSDSSSAVPRSIASHLWEFRAKKDDCLLGDEDGAQPLYTEGLGHGGQLISDNSEAVEVVKNALGMFFLCRSVGRSADSAMLLETGQVTVLDGELLSRVEERSDLLLKVEWGAGVSDCFYNAGWTEDIRKIIDHLHYQYPEAPLFVVGTSIGANILVKYLGEDGINTPVAGAAAVCSPWDLLSRSVRDFDNYATRVLAKFETVDTFYRRCSSINFIGNVMVPLLCISALDDPVCTREAIPWDECRWVRAVHEFFSVLQTSSLIHRKKEAEIQVPHSISPQESSIDQAPHVNITEDGMVTAMGNEQTNVEDAHDEPINQNEVGVDKISETHRGDQVTGERTHLTDDPPQPQGRDANDINIPVRTYMDRLSRHSRKSIWLLAYIAIITTWPLVGPALSLLFKKRIRNALPAVLKRK
ncbi:alpha/beta-Hydrolases superfamily protein [Actinidia rufa]|uniref:Alpha/beta-Hydrolases superfamily protein n=1 Tax=Actinidia rufa TaxID=165716 RepID=A0A7J0EQ06_9ERIC|nr:alpha/beta-Hydrolases superfamily protein [Actinidia rufa]